MTGIDPFRATRYCITPLALIKKGWFMFAKNRVPTIQYLRGTLLALAILAVSGKCGESANWVDARIAGPFTCQADFSLAGLEGVLDSFALLQTDLVQLLSVAPAKEPIEIYLFHDKATYSAYLKRYLPGVPNRKALYVKNLSLIHI